MKTINGRQFMCINEKTGETEAEELRLESTGFSNMHLIICVSLDAPVGAVINDKYYFVGDRVKVTDDGRGYIAPGIKRPGYGIIQSVKRDNTDHFFNILMDNGEKGTVKAWRIEVVA